MYIPLPLDALELNAPVPVNIWDPKGVMLLRKGEVIRDARHREYLLQHAPMVNEAEFKAWTYRYTSQIDRMVRGNESLNKIAGVTRPMGLDELKTLEDMSAAEAWPDMHASLTNLLYRNVEAQDFVTRLVQLENRLVQQLRYRVDDSLFVLVQMLFDRSVSYCATHALLSAVACRLAGATAGVTDTGLSALCRAALTMNIGMARLHDSLSRQDRILTPEQVQQVRAHPVMGVALLKQLGVGDPLWLQLVMDHHELPSGKGYPGGKTVTSLATQLLHLTDVFIGRISPRQHRPGLLPQVAARDVYLGDDGQPSVAGAAFVKTLGLYIPGSYVRLANGEMGVVVRRGRRANTPLVYAIVRHDMPLGEPVLRDTSERAYEVQSSALADMVKVRINAERLLSRM